MSIARAPAGVGLCLPLLAGVAIMFVGGAPVMRWGLHLGIGVAGLLVYLALRRAPRLPWLAIGGLCVAAMASTLLAPGIEGMRRWHEIGALRIHPSALLAPVVLMIASRWIAERPGVAWSLLLGAQLVHLLQPDAGQATAFGAATLAVLAGRAGTSRPLLIATLLGSIAATWLRPDPLPPAAFVEDIVARAFAIAPGVGVVAVLALVPGVLAPLRAAPGRAALALSVYLACSVVVVCFGEFPVPLLGFGPSPALGAFLGLAVFERLHMRPIELPEHAPSGSDSPASGLKFSARLEA